MSRDFRIKITSGGILEEKDHAWRLSRLHHWFSCAVPTFRRGDFRVRRYSKGEFGRTILVNLNWTVENGSAKGRGEVRRLGAQIAAKIENPPTRGLRGLQSNWCYTQADKRAGGAPSARKFYQRNRCLPTEAVFVAPVTRLASQSLARSFARQSTEESWPPSARRREASPISRRSVIVRELCKTSNWSISLRSFKYVLHEITDNCHDVS